MNFSITSRNAEMVMALVHYFITEENYTPIMVQGAKDEIWLENVDGPYRIIRINSNHIHNNEQYKFDLFKINNIVEQIKKKTLSLKVNTLNILVDVGDNCTIDSENKNINSIVIPNMEDITKDKQINAIFPNLKNKLVKDKQGIELIVDVTNDINEKTYKDSEIFNKIFSPKKPIMTISLIIICVLMFIATYIFGSGSESVETLLKFGANYQPLIKAGEVWRLITSMFLHIGILHLLFNMYALWIVGRQLESFLGKTKFIIVYLGSGLLGSLLSVVLHTTVSAGASGAIFGLLGSLLYFGYHYRLYLGTVLKTQIIPVIILNLIIGFTLSGIDNFAHIGGLIGGYLLTMALGIPGRDAKKEQINGWIVYILLILFLGYMLFR